MKNVLFIASEAVPFIKTGGLADVVGALPKYFNKDEFDVAGDAVSSQRQHCQEAENVVFINRNSGGISSEVDECAA